MSRRIEAQSTKAILQESRTRLDDRSFDLPIVDDVETASSHEAATVCASPVCSVSFEQTGMKIKPRRYCSDECKMDAWAFKRMARLLEGLADERVIQILRGNR
jgi:hypothetical protein